MAAPPFATDLANRALDHLGQAPITAIDASDADSRRMARAWRRSLDFVLRDHPWNVAERQAVPLPALAEAPRFGFAAAYQLPGDALRVLHVAGDPAVPFKVYGRILHTDAAAPLDLAYIGDLSDVGAIADPMLFEAAALHLAWATCLAVSQKAALREQLMREYRVIVARGRGVDALEGLAPPEPPSAFELARL